MRLYQSLLALISLSLIGCGTVSTYTDPDEEAIQQFYVEFDGLMAAKKREEATALTIRNFNLLHSKTASKCVDKNPVDGYCRELDVASYRHSYYYLISYVSFTKVIFDAPTNKYEVTKKCMYYGVNALANTFGNSSERNEIFKHVDICHQLYMQSIRSIPSNDRPSTDKLQKLDSQIARIKQLKALSKSSKVKAIRNKVYPENTPTFALRYLEMSQFYFKNNQRSEAAKYAVLAKSSYESWKKSQVELNQTLQERAERQKLMAEISLGFQKGLLDNAYTGSTGNQYSDMSLALQESYIQTLDNDIETYNLNFGEVKETKLSDFILNEL
ncbi:hypothetical protein [Vibrio sp. 705]|uniref:hypothetical protein n=1 Tax=Vibrio sp. 705 TaxID=3074611 RepID=UPI002964571F|nr:hypothetical protein [Vibrio sp. 705]MDG2675962.1 hypothetical protein [Vibrio parahaemolyticus]MDW1906244.1 hypothetical protein [Vibrio sp. 705]